MSKGNEVHPEEGARTLLLTVRADPDGSVAQQLGRDIAFADWWAQVPWSLRNEIRDELAAEVSR